MTTKKIKHKMLLQVTGISKSYYNSIMHTVGCEIPAHECLNNVHESVILGKYEQALIPAEWETSLSQAVHQCLGTCRSPC